MVLSFFFSSRIIQTGILESGLNQSVENRKQNQKQNQDITGRFIFAETSLPKRPVPSGNGDCEAIAVGVGLCDGEGERAYTAYSPHYDSQST